MKVSVCLRKDITSKRVGKVGISLLHCPKESRSIIQAQAMPDGRGSEESTIFVAGLPDDMTNLEMHR